MKVTDRGNGPEFQEHRSIDLDGMSISDVADYLIREAEGLSDPKVVIETEYGYENDAYTIQHVVGWRPATSEEIRQAAHERLQAEQRQRAWDEQAAAELRKRRPDLFT